MVRKCITVVKTSSKYTNSIILYYFPVSVENK